LRKKNKIADLRVISKGIGVTVPLLLSVFFAACVSNHLPGTQSAYLSERAEKLAVKINKKPSYKWLGKHKGLRTYWGRKDVSIRVQAFFPQDWQYPGDAAWKVQASTENNMPLSFIGIIRRYTNRNQTQLAKIVPPLNLSKIKDGLYIAIDPDVVKKNEKIKTIQPVAVVCEIRDHAFQPFRVKIPLFPRNKSALTPPPDKQSQMPEVDGTAFPYD